MGLGGEYVKVRRLLIDLEQAISLTETTKWKFFTVEDEIQCITLEIPRGERERLEVIIGWNTPEEKANTITALILANFVEQKTHREANF